jgi:hypothetical protein
MVTISVAVVIALAFFVTIWRSVTVGASRAFRGAAMTFTPQNTKGELVSFEARHERYMKIAEVVTTLASASLVFVPSSRLSAYPHSCAFALVLLGFTVLYSVAFMAVLTYFYEGFLYNEQSYRPWKYGLVHALGFGCLFCFALAYLLLAVRVSNAVIYSLGTTATSKPLP